MWKELNLWIFFKLLVERRICEWIADADVLVVNGEQVLNGMFAVGKGTYLESGDEIQRVIMNLIPCNAVFKHSKGGTDDLPSITQYLSLVLAQDERLEFYQGDMTVAFYLFGIPAGWLAAMSFNIWFDGEKIGREKGVRLRPACRVIPMGWASAVSVMQELAERLATISQLPEGYRVRRTSPLPSWLTEVCDRAVATNRPWFHVYLDNFCAMEVRTREGDEAKGPAFHQSLESTWQKVGVLSSSKKRVSGATMIDEL